MKKILVKGMKCGHCKGKIKNAIEELGGTIVDIDLDNKIVSVDILASDEDIRNSIEEYGFEVDSIE